MCAHAAEKEQVMEGEREGVKKGGRVRDRDEITVCS